MHEVTKVINLTLPFFNLFIPGTVIKPLRLIYYLWRKLTKVSCLLYKPNQYIPIHTDSISTYLTHVKNEYISTYTIPVQTESIWKPNDSHKKTKPVSTYLALMQTVHISTDRTLAQFQPIWLSCKPNLCQPIWFSFKRNIY